MKALEDWFWRVLLAIGSVACALLLIAWPISHLPSHPLGDQYPPGVMPVKLYAVDGELWLEHRMLPPSRYWPAGLYTAQSCGPIWKLLLWLGWIPPALWYISRPDRRSGHCVCGYNLTGNVSGVCPECGTPLSDRVSPNAGENEPPGSLNTTTDKRTIDPTTDH